VPHRLFDSTRLVGQGRQNFISAPLGQAHIFDAESLGIDWDLRLECDGPARARSVSGSPSQHSNPIVCRSQNLVAFGSAGLMSGVGMRLPIAGAGDQLPVVVSTGWNCGGRP
jgi:hypothetical protein